MEVSQAAVTIDRVGAFLDAYFTRFPRVLLIADRWGRLQALSLGWGATGRPHAESEGPAIGSRMASCLTLGGVSVSSLSSVFLFVYTLKGTSVVNQNLL